MPEVVQGNMGCLHQPVPNFNLSVCGGCGHSATALMLTFLLEATSDVAAKAAKWEDEVRLSIACAYLGSAICTFWFYANAVRVCLALYRCGSSTINVNQ